MRLRSTLIVIAGTVLLTSPLLSAQDTKLEPAPNGVSALTMDELIRQLPPAGEEWKWDRQKCESIKDAASEEMEKRLISGTLSDEQWRSALLSTGAIRFRERWPAEQEYVVSMTVPRWLGVTQIRLRPKSPGLHALEAGELFVGISGTFAMIDARDARVGRRIGKLPADAASLDFDIEVERGDSFLQGPLREGDVPPNAAKGVLWKGVITLPVKPVASWKEAVPASDDRSLDAAVGDAIGAGFRQWGPSDERVPFLVVDPDCGKFPALKHLGLDLKAQILSNERVIAESALVATDPDTMSLSSSVSAARKRFYGSANLNIPTEDHKNADRWVIRLRGDSEHLWSLWSAHTRWTGSIDIPWAEAVKHEAEKTGPKGRGPEVSTPHWK